MNGIHDLGGMHGFAPVAVEPDEPVFHADWERRVLSIMLGLAGQGRYNADQFRAMRETIPPARYLVARYYELWLYAVERLLESDISTEEIEERRDRLRAGEQSPDRRDPSLADRLRRQLREGHDTAGPAPSPHVFVVGDEVTARNAHPKGHTRMPRYVRGRRGVVVALYPAFPLPDRNGHGLPTPFENLYAVRFSGRELWGDDAEPGTELTIDLWESYLVTDAAGGSTHG